MRAIAEGPTEPVLRKLGLVFWSWDYEDAISGPRHRTPVHIRMSHPPTTPYTCQVTPKCHAEYTRSEGASRLGHKGAWLHESFRQDSVRAASWGPFKFTAVSALQECIKPLLKTRLASRYLFPTSPIHNDIYHPPFRS